MQWRTVTGRLPREIAAGLVKIVQHSTITLLNSSNNCSFLLLVNLITFFRCPMLLMEV